MSKEILCQNIEILQSKIDSLVMQICGMYGELAVTIHTLQDKVSELQDLNND